MMTDSEELKHVLRGLLISVPPDKCMTVNQLYSDYKEIDGQAYPYKKLGFKTFSDYLKSIPDTVALLDPYSKNSRVVGVASSKNVHLQELVSTQKCATKSRKRHPPWMLNRRYDHQGRYSYQYHEVAVSEIVQTRILNFLQQFKRGVTKKEFALFLENVEEIDPSLKTNIPLLYREIRHLLFYDDRRVYANRYAKVIPDKNNSDDYFDQSDELIPPLIEPQIDLCGYESEPEFVDLNSSKTFNSSSFGSLELDSRAENISPSSSSTLNSSENDRSLLEDNGKEDVVSIASSSSDSSVYEPKELSPIRDISSEISPVLRQNLIGLIDKYPKGIWLIDLCKKYEKEYGYTLQVKQHGCYNAFDFVSHLPSIFYITKLSTEGHVLLRDARKYKDDDKAPKLPKEIKDNIVAIIKKHVAVHMDQLQVEYKQKYGKSLVAEDYNFASLDDLIIHLEDYIKLNAVGGRLMLVINELKRTTEVPEYLVVNHCPSKEDYDLLASTFENVYPEGVCGKDFFIPEQELPNDCAIGSEIPVLMSQVITPCLFFVHLHDKYLALEDMMSNLNTYYNEKEKTKEYAVILDNVHVGLYCVCRYQYDRLWYRVRVINAEDKSSVKVRFIDYGTVGKIDSEYLRYLSTKFTNFPTQGLCIRQVGMKPATSDNKWTAESRDALLDITNQNLIMQVVLLNQVDKNANLEDEIPILDCHVLREFDRVRLSTILIKLGQALDPENEEETKQESRDSKPPKSIPSTSSNNVHSTPKRRKNKSQKSIAVRQSEPVEIPTAVEANPTERLPWPELDPPKPINRAKLGPPPGFGPLPVHEKSIPPRYESPPDYASVTSDRLRQSSGTVPSLSAVSKSFVPRIVEGSHSAAPTDIRLNSIDNISGSANALPYQQPSQIRNAPYNTPPSVHRPYTNFPSPWINFYHGSSLYPQHSTCEPEYSYPSPKSSYYQNLLRHPTHLPSYTNIRTPCQRYPDFGRYPFSLTSVPSPMLPDLPILPQPFAHGQGNSFGYNGLQPGIYNPTTINPLPVDGQSFINMPINDPNYMQSQTPFTFDANQADRVPENRNVNSGISNASNDRYSADVNIRGTRYASLPPGLGPPPTLQASSSWNISNSAPNMLNDRQTKQRQKRSQTKICDRDTNNAVDMTVLPAGNQVRSFLKVDGGLLNSSNDRHVAKTIDKCASISPPPGLESTNIVQPQEGSIGNVRSDTMNILNDRFPTNTQIDVPVLSTHKEESGNVDKHDRGSTIRSKNASLPSELLASTKIPQSLFTHTNGGMLNLSNDVYPGQLSLSSGNVPTTMKVTAADGLECSFGNIDRLQNGIARNGSTRCGNFSGKLSNLDTGVSELVVFEREPQQMLETEIDLIDFGEDFTLQSGNTTRLMDDPFEILDNGVELMNPLCPVKVDGSRNDNNTLLTTRQLKENTVADSNNGLCVNDDVSTFIRVPPPRVARYDY